MEPDLEDLPAEDPERSDLGPLTILERHDDVGRVGIISLVDIGR